MAKKPGGKKKVRTEFRKNRQVRVRDHDLTRRWQSEENDESNAVASERISGKGELTRKRTIIGSEVESEDEALAVQLDVDLSECIAGRVLSVHGLASFVETESGDIYRCATRRLLKSLATDQRNVVVAGDRVLFRPAGEDEGIIERVEPRHGVISRTSKGRRHVLVSNVDQVLIVASAAEPDLKPHLIDRMLVTAEKSEIEPIICINKIDLVDGADLQPIIGVYSQLGYRVLALSVVEGIGIEALRDLMAGRQSVVAGQSGVGKSSLLNALEPDLGLRVNEVSRDNQKGRHTTTAARLIPVAFGGYVIDTPGIRQFELWDVIPEEVAGFFRDIRPYVSQCRFPDCTHTHEEGCAVKAGVEARRLDGRRYESYCAMIDDV